MGRPRQEFYRKGLWILDTNNNGTFDDNGQDAVFALGGLSGIFR